MIDAYPIEPDAKLTTDEINAAESARRLREWPSTNVPIAVSWHW